MQTTRREILKQAAAAASALAFPTIVPSTVFGQNAPSNRINIAAIGVGGRGTDDCQNQFLPQDDIRFVASVDVRRSRRDAFARLCNQKYGSEICKPYNDFREVLARNDVDAVVVSTPDHWHVPIACYAAKARKHMYVEKPLGVALAWEWKLRQAVKEANVIFQYGTQQRGDQGQFRRACELVRNGYIGQVKTVDVWSPDMSSQFSSATKPPYGSTETISVPEDLDYEMWIGPAPMKPYTADRASNFGAYHIYDYALGFIAGWAVHPLDIAQWGLGMDHTSPVRYEGKGKIPPKGSLWDTIEAWDVNCTYANGVVVRNMGHRDAEAVVKAYHPVWRDHGTTFHGTEGWISVDRVGLYASSKTIQDARIKDSEQHLIATASQARNFIDSIRSGKEPISPLESAIRVDTISHMCDLCIRLGRPIQWDPQKEQMVNDAEAARMLQRPLREPWKLG